MSWWTPFTITVTAADSGEDSVPKLVDRFEEVGLILRVLEALGAVTLVVIVLVIPTGAVSFGVPGLIAGVTVWLVLAGLMAILYGIGLTRLGLDRGTVLRNVAAMFWPFSTPAAAERLLNLTVRDISSVAVAKLLFKPGDFAAWIRPRAYDVLDGADDPSVSAVLTIEEIAEIVNAPPSDPTARVVCTRCGSMWREAVANCNTCQVPVQAVTARS